MSDDQPLDAVIRDYDITADPRPIPQDPAEARVMQFMLESARREQERMQAVEQAPVQKPPRISLAENGVTRIVVEHTEEWEEATYALLLAVLMERFKGLSITEQEGQAGQGDRPLTLHLGQILAIDVRMRPDTPDQAVHETLESLRVALPGVAISARIAPKPLGIE